MSARRWLCPVPTPTSLNIQKHMLNSHSTVRSQGHFTVTIPEGLYIKTSGYDAWLEREKQR